MMLARKAILGFNVWSADVTKAYLQSSKPTSRSIFIKNTPEKFELKLDKCLHLLKPLYGVCDSSDLWHKTLMDHLESDLGLFTVSSELSMHVLHDKNKLISMHSSFVDDLLRCGDKMFLDTCLKTDSRFQTGNDNCISLRFAVFDISRLSNESIQIDQLKYVKKLEQLQPTAKFSDFRSMRMKIALAI